jgi:23S rRNA pseudouridine1911/1915/1917 synthase
MKSVPRGGREAVTLYRVLETYPAASLVEVEIPTGRSHQIRVHFAEAGHPLLGDSKYGRKNIPGVVECERAMLHAFRLDLRHPLRDENLCLEAPLPEDMKKIICRLASS